MLAFEPPFYERDSRLPAMTVSMAGKGEAVSTGAMERAKSGRCIVAD